MTPEQPIAVCVFAKPPRPGAAKTRLSAAIGDARAAALAAAFLRDTWDAVARLPWARPILATTDIEWGRASGVGAQEIWAQGDGDLGARLERVLGRALHTSPAALAVGTDSPGLPARLFDEARDALSSGAAVIGPAADGGYYLLGLPRCPTGLLADLPWSAPDTCARTADRLRGAGFRLHLLEPWFDIDWPEDLERLGRLLATAAVHAPHTAAALASLEVSRL